MTTSTTPLPVLSPAQRTLFLVTKRAAFEAYANLPSAERAYTDQTGYVIAQLNQFYKNRTIVEKQNLDDYISFMTDTTTEQE